MSAGYAACSYAEAEALKARVRELESLLEAADAELDRRDIHLGALRGTVPGDQGGESRRPQVGDRFEHYKGDPLGFVTLVAVSAPAATCFDNDCRMRWDDGSEQDYHTSFLLGEYGSAWRPAPPATQGAAAAGPACDECGDRGGRWDEEAIDQWYPCRTCETDEPAPPPPAAAGPAVPVVALACPACCFAHHDEGEWATRVHRTHLCLRCGYKWRVEPPVFGAPPPPASEPPPTAEEAAFLRGASLSVTKMAEQVRLLRVDLDAAVAGKAALEVRLRDEAEALEHECAAHVLTKRERDALAARLEAAREAYVNAADASGMLAIELVTVEKRLKSLWTWGHMTAQLNHAARSMLVPNGHTPTGFEDCGDNVCKTARAALAALGPGEGT